MEENSLLLKKMLSPPYLLISLWEFMIAKAFHFYIYSFDGKETLLVLHVIELVAFTCLWPSLLIRNSSLDEAAHSPHSDCYGQDTLLCNHLNV